MPNTLHMTDRERAAHTAATLFEAAADTIECAREARDAHMAAEFVTHLASYARLLNREARNYREQASKSAPLFPLGQVSISRAARDAFAASGDAPDAPLSLLYQHQHGQWGECEADDRAANDASVRDGSRILSAYVLADGARVWILTEADRSRTTILLPEEY